MRSSVRSRLAPPNSQALANTSDSQSCHTNLNRLAWSCLELRRRGRCLSQSTESLSNERHGDVAPTMRTGCKVNAQRDSREMWQACLHSLPRRKSKTVEAQTG